MSTETRQELWGAETRKAVENFPVSGQPIPVPVARWLGQIKPMIGLIWFAALVLPWFVAITGRAGEAFYSESLGHDLLTKIFSGQESHGAPPGYYFVLFWITFWPGATLAALAAPFVWTARHEPAINAAKRSGSCGRAGDTVIWV